MFGAPLSHQDASKETIPHAGVPTNHMLKHSGLCRIGSETDHDSCYILVTSPSPTFPDSVPAPDFVLHCLFYYVLDIEREAFGPHYFQHGRLIFTVAASSRTVGFRPQGRPRLVCQERKRLV